MGRLCRRGDKPDVAVMGASKPAHLPEYSLLDRVFDVLDAEGIGPETILFSSAVHEWLDEIIQRQPDFEVQALVALWPHDPADFGDSRFHTYNVRRTRVFPEDVRAAVDRGLSVNIYVVNEEEDMLAYAQAGAAGLPLPVRHRACLAEEGARLGQGPGWRPARDRT